MQLSNLKRRKITEDSDSNSESERPDEIDNNKKKADLVIVPEMGKDVDESLPLLLRNQIKGMKDIKNDNEKFVYDVKSRPEMKEEAYSNVKIEDFGAALLRGMGWRPDVGIGNNPKVVEPVINETVRPNLLGLGAVPKPDKNGLQNNNQRSKSASKWLCKQAIVKVVAGRYQGEFAIVKEVDGVPGLDNIIIQISPGADSGVLEYLPEVVIKRNDVNLLDKSTLHETHPAKLLLKQSIAQMKKITTQEDANQESANSSIDRKPEENTDSGKERKKKKKLCWLLPDIRVRIMSRSLANGKYYGEKGIINDVLDERKCTCVVKIGQGRSSVYVEKVYQDQLDTALPKIGGQVLIVRGERRGQRGKLVERDSKRDKAKVQIDDVIVNYSFDDVAEHCYYDD